MQVEKQQPLSEAAPDPVRSFIEETSEAYSGYSPLNADYAAFASLSLSEFRRLLNCPALTGPQLRRMIRRAGLEHRTNAPDSCWASYLRDYMAQRSNDE